MSGLSRGNCALAAQLACVLEACAPKPGNVNKARDFHDATFQEFMAASSALGPSLWRSDQCSVGETVLGCVEATAKVARSNINLGMILLLVPLCKAALTTGDRRLRESLGGVLDSLSESDARLTYQAINKAKPSGMGKVDKQDLSDEPSGITLLDAMEMARNRDMVAREYCTAYEITFLEAAPALKANWESGSRLSEAILDTYLLLLARHPDSLVARKLGEGEARRVSRLAEDVLAEKDISSPAFRRKLEEMDLYLRDPSHRRNPGTTADLVAAALFVFLVEGNWLERFPELMARW